MTTNGHVEFRKWDCACGWTNCTAAPGLDVCTTCHRREPRREARQIVWDFETMTITEGAPVNA